MVDYLIIDDPVPTQVGSRAVYGDLLVLDQPVPPRLLERPSVSVIVFDGESTVAVVEEESDVLVFDATASTQVLHRDTGADFLLITSDGMPGPKGDPSTVPGPPGPPTFPYVQPENPDLTEPEPVPEGTLWLDTDEFIGPVNMIKVVHGDDPNVLRPDVALVYWVGSVTPVNARPDDLLLLTAVSFEMVKVEHGDDPNMPRPPVPLVYWVGSVRPFNADPDDLLLLRSA